MGLAVKKLLLSSILAFTTAVSSSAQTKEDWVFSRPSEARKEQIKNLEQIVTFDDVVKNPDDIVKGQALVNRLVREIYGDKAHQDVNEYYYDPKEEIVVKDFERVQGELTLNQDYHEFIKSKLKDKDYFENAVENLKENTAFKKIPEKKREAIIREFLTRDSGIHFYINSQSEKEKNLFLKRFNQAFAQMITLDQKPYIFSKSNVYIHKGGFTDTTRILEQVVSVNIGAEEYYLSLKQKPNVETLKGIIVHEVKHCQDYNQGFAFGKDLKLLPPDFLKLSDPIFAVILESRANIEELDYHRRQNKGSYQFAYISQIFYISDKIDSWEDILKKERRNGFERPYIEYQLAELRKTKSEIRTVLEERKRIFENVMKAFEQGKK